MSSEQNYIDNKLDYLPPDILNYLKDVQTKPNVNKDILFPQNTNNNTSKNVKPVKQPPFIDLSIVRGDEINKLNHPIEKLSVISLIPKELYIIKDEDKGNLEYNDHEFSSTEEAKQNLILFPTEYPQSRDEVKYLSWTLDKMLANRQRPDISLDNYSVNGADDLDGMIKLIYELDDVYNVVMHELGRQIFTSCDPRGSLIFELRNKYMELVRKIPDELSKLKFDVKDQVVKDKKLTQQIEEFQMSIKNLTEQLKEVKLRDIKVTENAESIHNELESALQDSARSKELLNEYHILYDLQRQRLDKQMSVMNNEKEDWSSLAFALSLKISDESLLNTTKRLRLVTKKLIQLSQHFTIYISDCDTMLTSKIQEISGKCLKQITQIHTETSKTLNNFYDLFHFLEEKFDLFTKHNLNNSIDQFNMIINHLSSLKGFLAEDALKKIITDISLLSVNNYQSINLSIDELLVEWEINVNKLSNRKPLLIDQLKDEFKFEDFSMIYETIRNWTKEFSIRINLISTFEPFFHDLKFNITKIETKIQEIISKNEINDKNNDVVIISTLINDLYLEMFNNPDLKSIKKNEDFTEFNKLYNSIQTLLATFSNRIDLYDAHLMETINNQQEKITDWIINALFLFSNMDHSNDIEMKFKDFTEVFQTIVERNQLIFEDVIEWTTIFSTASIEENKTNEITEYTEENSLWTSVAEILIKNIGEKIQELLVKRRKQSEKEIEKMTFENLNELIMDIISKTSDTNMYLAIETVKNLQLEILNAVSRINTANEKRVLLSKTLKEQQMEIKELEENISMMTAEYREFVKTD